MENEKWRYIEKEYIALRIKLASSEIFHLWFKTDGSDSSEQLLYNVEYFHIRTLMEEQELIRSFSRVLSGKQML
jgi:hypothetical protein